MGKKRTNLLSVTTYICRFLIKAPICFREQIRAITKLTLIYMTVNNTDHSLKSQDLGIEIVVSALQQKLQIIEERLDQQTFSTEEAADYLKIPVNTFNVICKDIAKHIVGRRNVYLRSDLDAYLHSKRKEPKRIVSPLSRKGMNNG